MNAKEGGYIATTEGDPLDLVLAAHEAGWPDPMAALADSERALGDRSWTEAPWTDRIAACQIACEAGITRACRGEGTGTPLSAEALEWLETALDELARRLA